MYVEYNGVTYHDCYESPTTGEIFFNGDKMVYKPAKSATDAPEILCKHITISDAGVCRTDIKRCNGDIKIVRTCT